MKSCPEQIGKKVHGDRTKQITERDCKQREFKILRKKLIVELTGSQPQKSVHQSLESPDFEGKDIQQKAAEKSHNDGGFIPLHESADRHQNHDKIGGNLRNGKPPEHRCLEDKKDKY